MADKLELKVVTPSRLVVNEQVDEVVAPGELGEFGVLPGHVPFITLLTPGELKYRKSGAEKKIILWGGVSEVRNDRVTILTDNAEEPESINQEAARREVEAVLEELKNFGGDSKEQKELNRRLRLAQVRAGI